MKDLQVEDFMESARIYKIMVIDGQGGKLGKQLVESIRAVLPAVHMTVVGTNSMATANMMKAGVDAAATGENAVIVGCRTAEIIVGPVGIVIADSLHGEITPGMAVAIGQSLAQKVLIPVNKCSHTVVGVADYSMTRLIEAAVNTIRSFCS
jgi:hypothetical protein